nr:MAG TPA: hypothetical protein [Caudoviricetes sp.]
MERVFMFTGMKHRQGLEVDLGREVVPGQEAEQALCREDLGLKVVPGQEAEQALCQEDQGPKAVLVRGAERELYREVPEQAVVQRRREEQELCKEALGQARLLSQVVATFWMHLKRRTIRKNQKRIRAFLYLWENDMPIMEKCIS